MLEINERKQCFESLLNYDASARVDAPFVSHS
jgi:hypothetical protein